MLSGHLTNFQKFSETIWVDSLKDTIKTNEGIYLYSFWFFFKVDIWSTLLLELPAMLYHYVKCFAHIVSFNTLNNPIR